MAISTVGPIVKTLRTARKLKQCDFADRLRITKNYLSALEAGRRSPSLELVTKMENVLGLPGGVLLSMVGEGAEVPEHLKPIHDKLREVQSLLLMEYLRNGPSDEKET